MRAHPKGGKIGLNLQIQCAWNKITIKYQIVLVKLGDYEINIQLHRIVT